MLNLDVLQGETIACAGHIGDHEHVGVQHVVELHALGIGPSVAIVDDEMVELDRVVRVREMGLADDKGVGCRVGIDEEGSFLVEIEAIAGTNIATAGTFGIAVPSMIAPREMSSNPVPA